MPPNRACVMKVLVKYGLDTGAGYELLADSSILPTGRPLFIPDWAHHFAGTLAVAVRISRLGKCIAPRFAHRYWDGFTASLVTRGQAADGDTIDIQALSRGHDGALLLGQMVPASALEQDGALLRWMVNNQPVGQMGLHGMGDIVNATISHVSNYMTLKMGDLLCLCGDATGHRAIDTTTEITLGKQALLRMHIK